MSDRQTPPSTTELAATAAQTVRELNYRTRGPDAFTGPAELYLLVTELVPLVDSLPQLINQLGRWLRAEHHADRVRSDNSTDPGPTVSGATTELANAGDAARDLAHALASAQELLAHLGAPPDHPACSRISISNHDRPPDPAT
jgi:hypothetical protein